MTLVAAGSDSIRKYISWTDPWLVSLNWGDGNIVYVRLCSNATNNKGERIDRRSFVFFIRSRLKNDTRYTLRCVSRLRVSRQAFVGSTEITFNDTKRSRLDSRFTEPVTWTIVKEKKGGKTTILNLIIISNNKGFEKWTRNFSRRLTGNKDILEIVNESWKLYFCRAKRYVKLVILAFSTRLAQIDGKIGNEQGPSSKSRSVTCIDT